MGVIYQIVIEGGSRTYIGSAHDLKYRKRAHMSLLRKGKHHSRALQNAVKKYGFDAISWLILEEVADRSMLIEREQAWLDSFKGRLYNKSPTAGSRLGATMSATAKAKISASLKGNQYRKGIPHDAEAKAKISAAVKRSIAEGRRVYTGEQFQKLRDDVASGAIYSPWKRSRQMVREVLSHLDISRSAARTADHFRMNKENVRAILRNAEAELNDAFEQNSTRQRHQRGYFIHPDWVDTLEELR